jgi:hypothetical protein
MQELKSEMKHLEQRATETLSWYLQAKCWKKQPRHAARHSIRGSADMPWPCAKPCCIQCVSTRISSWGRVWNVMSFSVSSPIGI